MVLTEMINLAAEIAEQLLVAKDNESDGLLPKTKLDIIRLAELAATLPDLPEAEAEPAEPEIPKTSEDSKAPGDSMIPTPPHSPDPGLVAAEMRRLFSLNDLFLFRRELFQGSRVLFDRALEDIGACSSAARARELLISNYAIDPKRPEAKEFLAVISGLF